MPRVVGPGPHPQTGGPGAATWCNLGGIEAVSLNPNSWWLGVSLGGKSGKGIVMTSLAPWVSQCWALWRNSGGEGEKACKQSKPRATTMLSSRPGVLQLKRKKVFLSLVWTLLPIFPQLAGLGPGGSLTLPAWSIRGGHSVFPPPASALSPSPEGTDGQALTRLGAGKYPLSS